VSHLSDAPHAPGPAGGAVAAGVAAASVFVSVLGVSVVVSFAAFAAFAAASAAATSAVFFAFGGSTTNPLFAIVGSASFPVKAAGSDNVIGGSTVHTNAAFALVTYTQGLGSSVKSLAD